MIFQLTKFKYGLQNQQGVTLLLGLLIMGSLLAISLSVATVILVEIKGSGDLGLSETAYQGSVGLGEVGIFNNKRNVPTASTTAVTSLGTKVTFDPPVTSATSTASIQVRVPKEDTSFTSATTKLNIYNPENPISGSNYGRVTINYLSTGASQTLNIYVCQFNPALGMYSGNNGPKIACTDPDPSYAYWKQITTLTSGNSLDINDLSSTMQQAIIIYNSGTPSKDAYVQITSYDVDRLTPKGLPYSGYKTIDINAKSGSISRKIQFKVPN